MAAPTTGSRRLCAVLLGLALLLAASPCQAQSPLRKLGELEVSLFGLRAQVDPERPAVPRNVGAAVRLAVRAGDQELTAGQVIELFGAGVRVEAELSGPGLSGAVSLPPAGAALPGDPLLLPIPALAVGGDYQLSNVRLAAGGRAVLDASPADVPLRVSEILITGVSTRALTLDEIRAKGIVLDGDDYLGFDYTIGLLLDSQVVDLKFPVVFDRNGVAVPQPLLPPTADPGRAGVKLPTILPMLLEMQQADGQPVPPPRVTDPHTGESVPVHVPSVLVIPGDVGYLKQFFAAQLFVTNGAPTWANLELHDVTARITLPEGPAPGPEDDPLALPEIVRNGQTIPQPLEMPVRGPGPNKEPGDDDDDPILRPGERGQAEFLLRGEQEGFHRISFAIQGQLLGLPGGPLTVTGRAAGGVLVRNPFFDVAFTLPSVVRADEPFDVYVTVNNVSSVAANLVRVAFDAEALAGARLADGEDGVQTIDTLAGHESRVVRFRMVAQVTGQVVASYLRMNTDPGSSGGSNGQLNFALGVGERGVPLSPDTLSLPGPVASLPQPVVQAAMRLLGQAWSVANAPSGTLPPGVTRTSKQVVTQKALALAEAGLRVQLGQPLEAALRDVLLDFWGGTAPEEAPTRAEIDPGFDQLLRTTTAGRELAHALGAALAGAGDVTELERDLADVAGAGPDAITFAVDGGGGGLPVNVAFRDYGGLSTTADFGGDSQGNWDMPGGLAVALAESGEAPVLGLVTAPAQLTPPFSLELAGRRAGSVSVSATFPSLSGGRRVELSGIPTVPGSRVRLSFDPGHPGEVRVQLDLDGDGTFEQDDRQATPAQTPSGPRLLAAAVIGPETLAGANPFGTQAVAVFDRVVGEAAARAASAWTLPRNAVRSARRQLSGRLVFALLEQPEGHCSPTTLGLARPMLDTHGFEGPVGSVALDSRLREVGALVQGTVRQADGTPVGSGKVYYSNNTNFGCSPSCAISGLSELPLAGDGSFEFRFVRQDACGCPFQLTTRDPQSGAARTVEARVLGGGVGVCAAPMALDIALLGRGSVAGVVYDLAGRRVPGAQVVAASVGDPQSGGRALSGPDGSYLVPDVSVGPVTVKASAGNGLGVATGRIERAGTVAVVDVVLDGGAAAVSGTVRRVEAGATGPAPGATVVYYFRPVNASPQPLGLEQAGPTGAYRFEGMPVGPFTVEAHTSEGSDSVHGTAVAGELDRQDLLIVVPPPDQLGTVRGRVTTAGGGPAAGAAVVIDGYVLAVTDPEGLYEARQVQVRPGAVRQLSARLGRWQGEASFTLGVPGETVEDVDVQLSGTGSALFRVLDPQGNGLAGVDVAVLGAACPSACGCNPRPTIENGEVQFDDLPVGPVTVRALRSDGGLIDVADGRALVTGGNVLAQGLLQFRGVGKVEGVVRQPPQPGQNQGQPSHGAQVVLWRPAFDHQNCALVSQPASVSTDVDGRFAFPRVNAGEAQLLATHPFAPQAVSARHVLQAGETWTQELQLAETFAGELRGTVFLPDGTTGAGAGVQVTVNGVLPDTTVWTNADGHYAFGRILPAGAYTLTVRDPRGAGQAQTRVVLQVSQDLTQDLRLEGRGTVRVRIEDGGGEPVQRAAVTLKETDFPGRTFEKVLEPQHGGLLEFPGVYEGGFSVEAHDPYYRGGRVSGSVASPGAVSEVRLRLTVTGQVAGRFLMPDGATPISYGTVTLTAGGRVIGRLTTEGPGPQAGRFQFDYVPAGWVRLDAHDPLTGRRGVAAGTLESEDETLVVDVLAEGLGRVHGRVTSNGAARPGAEVRLAAGSFQATTMSDGLGSYGVDGVPVGRVVVTASLGSSFLAGSSAGNLEADGGDLPLDVALRDAAQVDGQVERWDGTTPGPVSRVSVTVGGVGGGQLAVASDGEGRFAFPMVPAGEARLHADVVGSLDEGSAQATVEAPGPVHVAVRLNGVGGLRGQAVDENGQPVDGTLIVTGSGAVPYSFTLALSANGRFELPEVLAGPFTARLVHREGGFTRYGVTSGVVVADRSDNEVLVALQPSATVTGRVLRADLTPAAGAEVTLVSASGARSTVGCTSQGQFTLRGAPLGPADLSVRDQITGGVARRSGLDLGPQGLELDDIVLDGRAPELAFLTPASGGSQLPFSGVFEITASDQNGVDPDSLVLAYPGNGFARPAGVDWDGTRFTGHFRGELLEPGANRVRARVTDLAGNPAEAEVVFDVVGGKVWGTVTDAQGQAVAGAAIAVDGQPAGATGPEGGYSVSGLREGPHEVVATGAPGYPVSVVVSLADGESRPVPLTLPEAARIVGTVVRRDGVTVVGDATVTAGVHASPTNGSGAFDLGWFLMGQHTVEASRPNGDRGRAVVDLVPGVPPAPVTLTLNGVGALTVAVVDPTGTTPQAVAGAAVTVTSSYAGSPVLTGTTSGPAGEATFPRVLAGTVTIRVEFEGRERTTTLALLDAETRREVVALAPAARIHGTVRRHDGSLAADATAWLVPVSGGQPRSLPVAPGTATYDFAAVPLGEYRVEATLPDGDRGRAPANVVADTPGGDYSADVQLTGVGVVEVEVRDAGGVVAGATVTVTSSSPLSTPVSKTTPADGLVRFEGVLRGDVTARAVKDGRSGQNGGALSAGATLPLLVTLQDLGAVDGTVRQAGGQAAAAGVRVVLLDAFGSLKGAATTGEDGRFRFESVTPGTHRLEARVDGRLRAFANGVVVAVGTTATRDLELIRTGVVAGVVRSGGAGVGGAELRLQSQSPVGGELTATSAPDGTYAIAGVPVGRVRLSAVLGGQRADAEGELPPSGGTLPVDLDLLDAAVSLPVSLGDGNAVFWEVRSDGSLAHGSMFDSWGATPRLRVDGVTFANQSGNQAATEESRREIVLRQEDLAGLRVTRKIYVSRDGYFVRYLDVLENPSDQPRQVPVELDYELGVAATVVGAADGWLVLDDQDDSDPYDASGDPASDAFMPLALVVSGPGGLPPTAASFARDGGLGTVRASWSLVSLPARGSVAFLHVLSAQATRSRAQLTAERLSQVPPELMLGMASAEGQAVANFVVPPDLVGGVPPLPRLDGVVDGRVLAFDGLTPAATGANRVVAFRSRIAHYGRPLWANGSAGEFHLAGHPAQGWVVPRAPFDLDGTVYWGSTTLQASASGAFGSGQVAGADVIFQGTGRVHGSVVQAPSGALVIGAAVTLSGAAGSVTVTAADGTFDFPIVPPGSYVLRATHPVGRNVVEVEVEVLPDTASQPAVAFPAGGSLAVSLRTALPTSSPVGGSLRLIGPDGYDRSLSVGSTGTLAIGEIPAGAYTLTATDDRAVLFNPRPRSSQQVVVVEGVLTPVTIAFAPLGSVTVRVETVREDGTRPIVANAPVEMEPLASGPGFRSVGRTGAGGELTVAGVPGPDVVVRVKHPSFPIQTIDLPLTIQGEGQSLAPVVTLPGVGSIHGQASVRGGATVVPDWVKATSLDGATYVTRDFPPGGAYSLDNLPVGTFRVLGRKELFYDWQFGSVAAVGDEVATVGYQDQRVARDVVLPMGVLGTGERQAWQFDGRAGQALGVHLSGYALLAPAPALDDPYLEIWSLDGVLLGQNDNRASYEKDALVGFTPASDGTYVAVARAAGSQTGGYGLGGVVARPLSGGRFVGRVIRETTQQEMVGIPVRLRFGDGLGETHVTDATGYAFEVFPPGPGWALEVLDSQGNVLSRTTASAPAPGAPDVAVDLPYPDGTATLRGRVVAGDGVTPLPGVTVTVTGLPPAGTDSAGLYELRGVPVGERQVSLAGWGATASHAVLVGSPETQAPDLALGVMVADVAVLEADGQASQEAVVRLCYYPGACVPELPVGPSGHALLYGLPASWYSVTVEAGVPGHDWIRAIETRSLWPRPPRLDVTMTLPGWAALGGVVASGASPVAGGLVWASQGAIELEAAIDGSGSYAFERVPAGEVRVYAEDEEGLPGAATTTLAHRSSGSLDVPLAPRAALEGFLSDSTGSIEGEVRVQVLDAPHRAARAAWEANLFADGGHFLRAIPAGRWRVVALDPGCAYGAGGSLAASEGRVAEGLGDVAMLELGSHGCLPFRPAEGQPELDYVRLDGQGGEPFPPFASFEPSGARRSLRVLSGALEIRTERHAPEGGDWSRTVTLLENVGPTTAVAQVTLTFDTYAPGIVASSSGNADFEPQDGWVVLTDGTALVVGDALQPLAARFFSGAGEGVGYLTSTYALDVPAGATRAVMAYHVHGSDVPARAVELTRMADPEALAGLSPGEVEAIANFERPGRRTVSGRVLDGGQPVGQARVAGMTAEGAVVAETEAGPDGHYALQLDDGAYWIVAQAPGTGRPGRTAVTVAGASLPGVDVELLPTSQLGIVRVTAAGGVQYEGRAVTLAVAGYSDAWSAQAVFGVSAEVAFEGVPPGLVTVTTDFGVVQRTLPSGGDVTITLMAGAGLASIGGDVRESDGSPAGGALVALVSGATGDVYLQAETNGSGRYLFHGVDLGTYTILAKDQVGNRPVDVAVSVNVDGIGLRAADPLVLVPAQEVGTLRVVATGEAGAAVANLPVTLHAARGCCQPFWPGTLQLGPDGVLELPGVPGGSVVAEVGAAPAYGWGQGELAAQSQLVLPVLVGGWVSLPHEIPATDGQRHLVNQWGEVQLDGIDRAFSIYPDPWDTVSVARVSMGGQQLELVNRMAWGHIHRRRVYVPSDGRFVRHLDLIENPTETPLSLPLPITWWQDLRGGPWTVSGSSDGDPVVFDAADRWATLAYPDEVTPQLAVVVQGSAPRLPFDLFQFGSDPGQGWLSWKTGWAALTVPSHGRVGVLQFVVQLPNGQAAAATSLAASLAELSESGALAGLSAEDRSAILNFPSLPAPREVSGRVLDGGQPVGQARVAGMTAEGAVVAETEAGPDGHYALQLDDGAYWIVAQAPGTGRPGRTAVTVAGASLPGVDVELLPTSQLGIVRVTAAGGVQYEGRAVTLAVAGYSDAWSAQAVFGVSAEVVFEGVPPGLVTVTTDFGVVQRTLPPGGGVVVDLMAGPGEATIRGGVLERDGTPVVGATVALVSGATGSVYLQTETNAAGEYAFHGVEAAGQVAYSVMAKEPVSNRPGDGAVSVTVPGGGSYTLAPLSLVPVGEVGDLRVVASHEAGGAVAGLPVALSPERGCCQPLWPGPLQLGPDGVVDVRGVPSGSVVAEVGAVPDYGRGQGQVPAQGPLVLPVRVGGWVGLPHEIPATDGQRHFVNQWGEVHLDEVDRAFSLYSEPWGGTPAAHVSLGGQELELFNRLGGGLVHRRRVYVPQDGRFVRHFDLIENPTEAQLTVGIQWWQDLWEGASNPWSVAQTSSGDELFDVSDEWARLSCQQDGVPALASVVRGSTPPLPFDVFEFDANPDEGWLSWGAGYAALAVPPHGRAAVLQFVVQLPQGQNAEAAALATALADLTEPAALVGLTSEDRAAVVNFSVAP